MALTFWDYFILLALLFGVFYYYLHKSIQFFQQNDIKTLPAYPVVGNMQSTFTRTMHFNELIEKVYSAFPEEKYVGFYQFQKPMIIIRDIELIKSIGIKDFNHFQNHMSLIDSDNDPLFARSLLNLTGEQWHDMRATLSPAFTSSKMRNMFLFTNECAEHLATFFMNKADEPCNKDLGYVEIEMKDTFTRYTNDIIATSAFGIPVDSLADRENIFYKMGKEATTFTKLQLLKMIAMIGMPKVMKLLKVKIFSTRVSNFFKDLVQNQMEQREKNNIVRPDMIHLLMQAKKGSLKYESNAETNSVEFSSVEESQIGKITVKRDWTDEDIIAQAVLFFFAGFETSSVLLSFLAHELTINPDIQKKLQMEITEVAEKNSGKLTYNDIQSMKYLDMVVSEALRKWPPGPITDRKCTKSYVLPATNSRGKPYELNINDGVWIPIGGIQRDPNYFPNPDKFDPERFSDENKSSIIPFTYLPFGIGPRNCIGSRFALMEAKTVIFHLLLKFDLVPTDKTVNPLVIDRKSIALQPEGGFWLGLKPRAK